MQLHSDFLLPSVHNVESVFWLQANLILMRLHSTLVYRYSQQQARGFATAPGGSKKKTLKEIWLGEYVANDHIEQQDVLTTCTS
jgi:hypothetical protein